MKKEIYLGGLSFLLTACGGINYVGIETCNPGEVTFPQDVRKVLMVNNAMAQPEKSGYTYSLLGVFRIRHRQRPTVPCSICAPLVEPLFWMLLILRMFSFFMISCVIREAV